jgi:DNA-binding MurR/RpiR family transcriptional regulator
MMVQEKEIFSRILERYDTHMTGAEQRIADHLLKNPHECITFSVATLAQAAGTSEATVVRFAKTLGFAGFLDFKQELLRRASRDLAHPERYDGIAMRRTCRVGADAASAQFTHVALVADSEVANIAETVEGLDCAAFEGMVNSLSRAQFIYTVGSGLSSYLARMAAYQFTILGKRAIALPESGSAYEEQMRLADARQDVLFAFSFPPYSKGVLSLAEFAASRGVDVLGITDRRQSPLARVSTHALVAANDNPLPLNSMTASTVLLTALLTAVSAKRPINPRESTHA